MHSSLWLLLFDIRAEPILSFDYSFPDIVVILALGTARYKVPFFAFYEDQTAVNSIGRNRGYKTVYIPNPKNLKSALDREKKKEVPFFTPSIESE